ncbi:MAG: threonine/serine exporter family protein [Eubacteriales bacterium]|mgnify:CR=1 FL=1|nr:threonine/serine exporter family protein [Eubacteriales bacterium]
MTDIIQLITSCLATLAACIGFSILFNLRGSGILLASLGGVIGWAVYLTTAMTGSDLLQSFLATIAITAYAEVMARMKKTPVTAFLIVSLLPLVPGSGIYYTMRYFVSGDTARFIDSGLHTLAIAGSLAIGILPVFSIVRLVSRFKNRRAATNGLS